MWGRDGGGSGLQGGRCNLTYYSLVMPYGKQILANNSLDNGLLPDGIKPLPEPTV